MTDPLTTAAVAVFDHASRKGQLHVTGPGGSDSLVGFFVPADLMNALGRALVHAGARLDHGEADPSLGRLVDSVTNRAVMTGHLDWNVLRKELDPEAVTGVVAMAREEWPAASADQLARGIDWDSIRRRGETREQYAERTGA